MRKIIQILCVLFFILMNLSCKQEEFRTKSPEQNWPRKTTANNVRNKEITAESKADLLQRIKLSKGEFLIPGEGYIDGRDLQAVPPLTIEKINIWDSYNRERVICQIKQGTKVKLLSTRIVMSESRYYIKVQSADCIGWVPESFLNTKKMEPIGDIF